MKLKLTLLSLAASCMLVQPAIAEYYDSYDSYDYNNMDNCCEDACSGNIDIGFYGKYLYLQPNGSDLYYGAEAVLLDPDLAVINASPDWHILDLGQQYHNAYEVGAEVYFRCLDLSMHSNWMSLRGFDKNKFETSSDAGFLVGPLFDIGPNAVEYKIARGKATYHFNEANFNIGKSYCPVEGLVARFYVGASLTNIKQTLKSTFSNDKGDVTRSIESPSKFRGAGPEFGLGYSYEVCGGLSLTGSSQFSLLIGRIRNHTTFESTSPELTAFHLPNPNVQKTSVERKTQLVPAFEQKLGIAYGMCLFSTFWTELEIGYQYQIYWNAVRTIDMTAPQALPDMAVFGSEVGVFAVGFQKNVNNFILSGPYASLNIKF